METRRQQVNTVGGVFEEKQEENPGRIWGGFWSGEWGGGEGGRRCRLIFFSGDLFTNNVISLF